MKNTNYKKEYEDLRSTLWELHGYSLEPWPERWKGMTTFLLFLLVVSLSVFVVPLALKIVGLFFFGVFLLILLGLIYESIKERGRAEVLEWADISLRWRREILKAGKAEDARLIEFFKKKKRPTEEETEAFFVAPKIRD